MLRRSLLLLCAVVFTPRAWAADPGSAGLRPMPAPDTGTFLAKTVTANTFEIESSKLAAAKSQSDAVRGFANSMIKDHVRMSAEFEQVVSDAGLKLPPVRMNSQGRFTCDDLRSKMAADFDKEYVQAQYNGHVETVEMFRAYANSGEDARLKRFAADALPTLQAHLALVKTLRK